jgi:hypothetical protein
MTAVAALATPGGRSIAGWWRQLAPFQPRDWWLADLWIHHVEVLAHCRQQARLEPIQKLLLESLTFFSVAAITNIGLRLGLPTAVIQSLLQHLAESGLATESGGSWQTTALGQTACAQGNYFQLDYERRSFTLVDDPSGLPVFLPLVHAGEPFHPPSDWVSPFQALRYCVQESDEWKKQRDFPSDIQAIVDPGSDLPIDVPEWRRVPIDRAERLTAVILHCHDERWLGYAVKADSWTLDANSAILQLSIADPQIPGCSEPDLSLWKQAWANWCRLVRGMTNEEIEACELERRAHRLCVRAPGKTLEKLKISRPEAFRGEGWLLAGTDRCRAMTQLEIT